MTGPAHFQEAERLLRLASDLDMGVMGHANKNGITTGELQAMAAQSANLVGAAQVHATLALAAATALAHDRMMPDRDGEQWRAVACTPNPGAVSDVD